MKQTLALAIPLFLLLAGCSKPSLVGTWELKSPAMVTTMEFTDTTFKSTSLKIMDKKPVIVNGEAIRTETSGTYTFDGKQLTLTVTDVKLPDAMKSQKTPTDMEKHTSAQDAELNGDKLTISPAEGSQGVSPITLTRAKT